MTRVLVIGYGNPGRQDDGLGPAVASGIDRLGWPGLTAFDNYQLTIEDAIEVAAHDVVWFVDASKTGPSPYAVQEVIPSLTIDFTSHLVRPEAVMAIARPMLWRRGAGFPPGRAWLRVRVRRGLDARG